MSAERTIAEKDDALDRNVLELLLARRRPWSIAELAAEAGELDAEDAVARLHSAGLVHRLSDGFAFPTRAAVRLSELDISVADGDDDRS